MHPHTCVHLYTTYTPTRTVHTPCTHTASQGLPLGVGVRKGEAHSSVQVLGPLRVLVCFQEHTQKSFGTRWCQEACPLWAQHLVQC